MRENFSHSLEIQPFKLKTIPKTSVKNRVMSAMGSALEYALALSKLNGIYAAIGPQKDVKSFVKATLDLLNIELKISHKDLKHIPKSGPTVVVANHPFGAIEGIILAHVLLSVRSDVKIFANYLLSRIPELQEIFYFVDPFERATSTQANIRSTRAALQHVKEGGILGVFPSGEVSHRKWTQWEVLDPPWNTSVGRIVKKTHANAIPIFFDGTNGKMFQVAGLLHAKLRTIMLPRELWNKREKVISLRIGNIIGPQKFDLQLTDEEITQYLRSRTYLLKYRKDLKSEKKVRILKTLYKKKKQAPIILEKNEFHKISEEVDQLPSDQHLLSHNEFSIKYAQAWQAPSLLQEIGRLREITFREVGEGTGKTLDLDEYDQRYLHLFVWHNSLKEVIGAYRFARTDEIIQKHGLSGLYTHRFFEFRSGFENIINPGLEFGRSFIRPEYQKTAWALPMLWKGITAFVCRNPKYRILFGPVSISSSYSRVSRRLIIEFLKERRFDTHLASLVKAKRPPKNEKLKTLRINELKEFIQGVDDLSELISDVDVQFPGVPILLKHYLRMGGKILGFNVDVDFSDSLDGLILVDLLDANEKLVKSYMGKDHYQKYLEFHQKNPRVA